MLVALSFALFMPIYMTLEFLHCMTNCFELMLYQNDETPYSQLNANIHNITKMFAYFGDYTLGVRIFQQKVYIFVQILYFFDIYVIKDFTLVDPSFIAAAICSYLLIYASNVSLLSVSSYFAKKSIKDTRNPHMLKRPLQSRDDIDEINREQEREAYLNEGGRQLVVTQVVKEFDVASWANTTIWRGIWLSLLTLVPVICC